MREAAAFFAALSEENWTMLTPKLLSTTVAALYLEKSTFFPLFNPTISLAEE